MFDPAKYGIPTIKTRQGFKAKLSKTDNSSGMPNTTVLTAQQRSDIAKDIIEKQISPKQVSFALDVCLSTVYRWTYEIKKLISEGVECPMLPCSSLGGAPHSLDSQAMVEYESYIAENQKKNKSVKANNDERILPFIEKLQDSQARRGKAALKTSVDPRTMISEEKRLGISMQKGREISHARVEAVDDPRNAITHGIALESFCKDRLPSLMGNMDSTQFMGIADNSNCQIMVAKSNGRIEARKEHAAETALFIKYISIYFTSGYSAPPILMCANEMVPEDEYFVDKVSLLSHSDSPHDYGYLAWTHTRAGNVNFFKWVFSEVVFPVIKEIRASSGLDESSEDYHDKAAAVFFLDGEAIQIQATQDPDILSQSDSALVYLFKHCASCSLIHQMCDLSSVYRNTKRDVATISEMEYKNVSLETHIRRSIDSKNDILSYTSNEKDKLVRICLKVIACLKKYINHQSIVKAGKDAGMLGESKSWPTIARKVPFQKSTHTWTALEFRNIFDQWDNMMEYFCNHGTLPDAYMDTLDLPRGQYDTTCVYKEDYVEYRWRITWLNHATVITAIRLRRNEKLAAASEAEAKKREGQRIKDSKFETDPILTCAKGFIDEAKSSKDNAVTQARVAMDAHIKAKKMHSEGVAEAKIARDDADEALNEAKIAFSDAKETFQEAISSAKNGDIIATREATAEVKKLAAIVSDAAAKAAKKADAAILASDKKASVDLIKPSVNKRRKQVNDKNSNDLMDLRGYSNEEKKAFFTAQLAKLVEENNN